ncbi:MAG: glycosyltransferase [Planctomycetes bacterium]|nr:glycosyltransferase [Planctomycetota bacterium]
MHFLLTTVGSAGDVHPFVGIGRTLAARGHRVTLMTSGHFEPLARQAGLDFVDPAPEWDFRESINRPELWHRYRGPRFVMDMVAETIEAQFQAVLAHAVPGETVIVASSLAMGARVAQEVAGLPLATVHLSPSLFRTIHAEVRLPGMFLPTWLPAPLKRLQFWLADRLIIDRVLGSKINAIRGRYGLAPARGIMGRWWHSPQLVLALFPEWFGAKQPDWPTQTVLTGFPLYDEGDLVEPSSELLSYLSAGSKPIVFTPGSANLHGREFFAAACDACRRLGRRGLLLTRFPEQIPAKLPDGVKHFDFVPFGWLLPRVAAVVHHGGIGSMSQGFAAGVPQLAMTMSFDQFDNVMRLERLNCGRGIDQRRFTGARAARLLGEMLDSSAVAQACERVRAMVHQDDAMETIANAVERLGTESAHFVKPGLHH